MTDRIRSPAEWILDQFGFAGHAIEETGRGIVGSEETRHSAPPVVRRISVADLKAALAKGVSDFAVFRTDVILLCFVYPLIGLLLAQWVFGFNMLPMAFPLVSGFALVAPLAAVALYEMSRRRERGMEVTWADAFAVAASPRFGAILVLGVVLLAIFAAWLFAAYTLYQVTVGPESPDVINSFLADVFGTPAGWTMIAAGFGIGFLFAVLVLMISVVSFPLLLDRDVGLPTAVVTSVRAVWANKGPMAVWGLVVAGGLAIGSVPALLGLPIVIPILGHATWHLYRAVVAGPFEGRVRAA